VTKATILSAQPPSLTGSIRSPKSAEIIITGNCLLESVRGGNGIFFIGKATIEQSKKPSLSELAGMT